jgi:hypothetical protein
MGERIKRGVIGREPGQAVDLRFDRDLVVW